MAKLVQILAIEQGIKNRINKDFTEAHQVLAKDALLTGISRNYRPINDDDITYPPESTQVQIQAEDVLIQASTYMGHLFDVTYAKDEANTRAKASVVLDGEVILQDAPATFLLWLEHKLIDLKTFIEKLPTLTENESWHLDDLLGVYRTAPFDTVKSKKVPQAFVKYEATKEHPAQVDVFNEDVPVGTWTTVKFSGALPATRVRQLTERIHALQDAVKFAREEANTIQVVEARPSRAIFEYLLAP